MSSTPALRHVFVGGYTAESDGRATGVGSLLNEGSGKRVRLEPASTLALVSPTWLTRHPSLPVLLSAGETTPGTVSSLRYDADGSLALLSTVETGGDGACHVAVSPDGAYAIVASYRSGSLATFAIADNGTLSEVVDTLQLVGSGPVSDRQEGPHAHQAVVVGDEVLCCDLGGDQIFRLRIDGDGRLLAAADPIRLPPGTGPRHLVHADDHLVVAGELSGELWLLTRDGDDWRSRARGRHVGPGRPRPALRHRDRRHPGLRGQPRGRHHRVSSTSTRPRTRSPRSRSSTAAGPGPVTSRWTADCSGSPTRTATRSRCSRSARCHRPAPRCS